MQFTHEMVWIWPLRIFVLFLISNYLLEAYLHCPFLLELVFVVCVLF